MRKALTVLGLLALAGWAGEAGAAGRLAIYNYTGYGAPETIARFEKLHDVTVTTDVIDSNETLLAKLKAGGGATGFDLAVATDYMVAVLIREGLVEKVEPNKLPNFKNVDPRWVDIYFDKGTEYSVPYQWGSTSFMVDTAVYKGPLDSLGLLFAPPPELAGRINMHKDMHDVINAGLRYLGFPRCNDKPEQLRALNDLLLKAKPNWRSFNADGSKELLVSGDIVASQAWNGLAMRARLERPTLRYVYPKEGSTAWVDNLVVLKGAQNLEMAKAFMDFMMDPKSSAELTNLARFSSPILGAEQYLDPELKAAPELNVPAGVTPPEVVPTCPDNVVKLYDRIWTNLLK